MKTLNLFAALFILAFLNTGCLKDTCTEIVSYEKYTPITLSPDEYRIAPQMEGPRDFEKTGKIYYYNNYILLNEYHQGIHLINNENPSTPIVEAFINIPGNVDMAIKNGVLFADGYNDLLSIRLNEMHGVELIKREEAVFPTFGLDENGLEILGYSIETVTEEVECNTKASNAVQFDGSFVFNSSSDNFSYDSQSGNVGLGGSLARFSIAGDHLYAIDNSNLHVFHIGDGQNLQTISNVSVGFGIETLFGHDNKLFIGGNLGMSIYDLSNPDMPGYLGGYEHIFSCDPVFVKDNYAYVTLRNGTTCRGVINQLDLVDISQPENVRLVKSFPMDNPHGLSIAENNLFLCEGDQGLKVFDISNPTDLANSLKSILPDIETRDVIRLPGNNKIILIVGPDGLYQFDYEDVYNLRLLSFLSLPKA